VTIIADAVLDALQVAVAGVGEIEPLAELVLDRVGGSPRGVDGVADLQPLGEGQPTTLVAGGVVPAVGIGDVDVLERLAEMAAGLRVVVLLQVVVRPADVLAGGARGRVADLLAAINATDVAPASETSVFVRFGASVVSGVCLLARRVDSCMS
jgi:hypothetical protein